MLFDRIAAMHRDGASIAHIRRELGLPLRIILKAIKLDQAVTVNQTGKGWADGVKKTPKDDKCKREKLAKREFERRALKYLFSSSRSTAIDRWKRRAKRGKDS